MPTLRRSTAHPGDAARAFGADADAYHRTRPRYPQALVDRVLRGALGRELLDVGIGTGISAAAFRDAGCRVLGVDPDARMAAYAQRQGFAVEVAAFEEWDPSGRTFDVLVAGTTWHWIDAARGAAKAAAVLRPGGRLALFWNVQQLPDALARDLAEVYRRVVPDFPFAAALHDPLAAYAPTLDAAEAALRGTGGFTRPQRWRLDWTQRYTKEQWLAQAATFGGHQSIEPAARAELAAEMDAAIERAGGTRSPRSPPSPS